MNQNWFKEWKDGVKELNRNSDEISKGKDEAFGLLSDKIKRIFDANGTPVESVKFSRDCSVVRVHLTGNTTNSIGFRKSFLFDIGMPFSVKRELNELAQNELYIELYPLEDD